MIVVAGQGPPVQTVTHTHPVWSGCSCVFRVIRGPGVDVFLLALRGKTAHGAAQLNPTLQGHSLLPRIPG